MFTFTFMNFLAHLYLSKNNTNIMIGNFIADHIRGNNFNHFSREIQQGIKLHREIDTFTRTCMPYIIKFFAASL